MSNTRITGEMIWEWVAEVSDINKISLQENIRLASIIKIMDYHIKLFSIEPLDSHEKDAVEKILEDYKNIIILDPFKESE